MKINDIGKFVAPKSKKYIDALLTAKNNEFITTIPHFSVFKLESALEYSDQYQNWFNNKLKCLKKADKSSVSSIFGEIRALGYLHEVFYDKLKPKCVNGPDFEIMISDQKIVIEVQTQLGAQKNTVINHGELQIGNIKFVESGWAPYSFPLTDKNSDTITGNAVSKIAAIKGTEHQFKKEDINILWLDFLDPGWIFPMNGEVRPINVFREKFTSGSIWWALYGSKNNKIFDELNIGDEPDIFYKMPFNGKFTKQSHLDFVIIINPNSTVVFQNYNRINPSSNIFFSLFNLPHFDFEESWLNYPLDDLRCRVIRKKCEISQLYKKLSFS